MRSAILFTAGLLTWLPAVHAEPRLGAYAIPGVFEPDKSGNYDKVLAKVAKDSGLKLDYVVLAPGRLETDFKDQKFDCVIPLDARFWSSNDKTFNSEPLNVAKIYLFSRATEGPYWNLDQVKGKRIGVRRGMPYGPVFDGSGLQAEVVNDDDQNVQKLAANRIDAFLAYVPDMWEWSKEKQRPLPNHDQTKPFETHKDAFLCRDTAETRAFAKTFNDAVIKIRAAGQLQQMLGSSYVP
jgi:ABC-type amino acid transport substrate-binding protein